MSEQMQSSQSRGEAVRQARALRWVALALLATAVVLAFVGAGVGAGAGKEKPDPRIVGGQEAEPGEWPWQVAVLEAGSDPYAGQFCGGTLIRPDWVVTAAHCVEFRYPVELEVAAGIHNLRFPDPDYQRRAVAEIILHPEWDTFTADNDIALLKLTTPVTYRPPAGTVLPIAPLPLVAANAGPLTGIMSTVIGWGNTLGQPFPGGASFPDALHEVEVPIISNPACSAAYSGITDNMLCAGVSQGGVDSCQGDSGGPLMVFDGAQSRWELAGIVSFGNGCAAPDYPGVYARVSRFINWILGEIGPDIIVTDKSFLPAQAAPVPPWITPTVTPTVTPTAPPEGLPLQNGDFEDGPVAWTMTSSTDIALILDDLSYAGITPHGGQWAARLAGAIEEANRIEQRVVVPADAPYLHFYRVIDSEDYCGYDFAGVTVNGTDNLLIESLCWDTETYGWRSVTLDLSRYAGLPVDLAFWATTDGSLNSTWFVDDITFTGTGPTPTPSPTVPPTATPSPTPTITPTAPPEGLPLQNGDFEQGQVSWREASNFGFDLIVNSFGDNNVTARSGDWAAWLGGAHNEAATITQRVIVPADQPYLVYHYQIGSFEGCGGQFDMARVLINGSAVVDSLELCSDNSYGRWAPRSVDLSDYAGLPVDLTFQVTTDTSSLSNLFIDDVEFRATAERDIAQRPAGNTGAAQPRGE